MDLTATCLVVTDGCGRITKTRLELLSNREMTRLRVLARQEDRERFVAGASLLRMVVSHLVGRPPAEVEVDRSCPDCRRWHGKPLVPLSGLHVSVSHSVDRVQVACTRAAPVGTDIQSRHSQVTAEMRTLLECAGLRLANTEEFLVAWTRIEAVVKATGEGLRVPLDQVRVSAPHQEPRLLAYRGHAMSCRLFEQASQADYVGSVAVLGSGAIDLVELSAQEFLQPRDPSRRDPDNAPG